MRVTFDSNAWEAVCDEGSSDFAPMRQALGTSRLQGFICEASLRIEAIAKRDRGAFFAQPHFGSRVGIVDLDGRPHLKLSFGPMDEVHPGLPAIQVVRLDVARALGMRFLRGLSWLGLPGPVETADPAGFAAETDEDRRRREQRQIEVFAKVCDRGVGKAVFDAAGGWNMSTASPDGTRRFAGACAEWSDGELVCAHVAYGNDVVCTNDRGRNAGTSIFDAKNREWLAATFGVRFMTPAELQVVAVDDDRRSPS